MTKNITVAIGSLPAHIHIDAVLRRRYDAISRTTHLHPQFSLWYWSSPCHHV